MELVGLDPATYADRYPHQLSGGQRQRVGVARALAADPPVLLMDEPFGAVDPVVRGRLQDEFLRLQHELGKTVVLVTHDIDEAVRMGDRVAIFATGGRLAQYGTPAELLAHPADEFVADFVGSTKGLRRLTVTRIDPDHLEPLDGVATGDLAGAIDIDATLEEALAALLRDDKQVVGVRRGPSSSASSPPTASTARFGRASSPVELAIAAALGAATARARQWMGLPPWSDVGRKGLRSGVAGRRGPSARPFRPVTQPSGPTHATIWANSTIRRRRILLEATPCQAMSSERSTSISCSSSATRTIASAARSSASSRRRVRLDALALGQVGAAGLGVAPAGRLGRAALGGDERLLQLVQRGLAIGQPGAEDAGVLGVLGGAGGPRSR